MIYNIIVFSLPVCFFVVGVWSVSISNRRRILILNIITNTKGEYPEVNKLVTPSSRLEYVFGKNLENIQKPLLKFLEKNPYSEDNTKLMELVTELRRLSIKQVILNRVIILLLFVYFIIIILV